MTFNTNKNSFISSVSSIKPDLHAFQSLGIAKSTKSSKQQKKALISTITAAIDDIDTDDFGIRIIIIKSHQ